MRRSLLLVPAFALAALALPARSADPIASSSTAPKTLMTTPGKVLLSEPLAAGLGMKFKAAKGKWEAVDGATRGAELKADMHGAAARISADMKDVVIQFSFRLDGAKGISLSLNAAKGHLCRLQISPTEFSVRKDKQDKNNAADKGVVLDTKQASIKPGEWHTMTVELRGADMLATLDGRETAYGSHDAIDKAKANLGFTVSGESASFKNLTVWEAAPSQDWDAAKAKLTAGKGKK